MKKIKCEVFSRVVGYYRPVMNWNDGKKEEFKDRKTYTMKKITENETYKPCEGTLLNYPQTV